MRPLPREPATVVERGGTLCMLLREWLERGSRLAREMIRRAAGQAPFD